MKYIPFIILMSLTSFSLYGQIANNDYFIYDDSINTDYEALIEKSEEKSKITVNARATFVSRFIWRGLELGDQPHFQPEVTFGWNNFFVGAWASHALSPVAFDESIPGYKEVIPYIGYTFNFTSSSSLDVLIMDHYNPNFQNFGDWDDEGRGGNTIELRTILKAGNFDFLGSVNLYNDTEHSAYLEFGYNFKLPNDFNVRPLVSLTPMESPFNGTDDFAFTQVGVITSKDIKITDHFTVPVKVDFIVNPELDKFYTAFGFGIVF
ncbi:MAG: TorF family putative porin [Bacteroidota bacterium]